MKPKYAWGPSTTVADGNTSFASKCRQSLRGSMLKVFSNCKKQRRISEPPLKRRSTSDSEMYIPTLRGRLLTSLMIDADHIPVLRKKVKSIKERCPIVIIEEEKWDNLNDVLIRTHKNEKGEKQTCPCDECDECQSLVHIACKHNPPMMSLIKLIGWCGEQACHPDFTTQQDPLHIALCNGASAEVISTLFLFNKSAANNHDFNGCSPISLFFQNFPNDWSRESRKEIVMKLCHVEPIPLLTPDSSGLTPLDYARVESEERELVVILQERTDEAKVILENIKKNLKYSKNGNKLAQYLLAVGAVAGSKQPFQEECHNT